MHGDVSLGGPIWLLATSLILGALVFALFVAIDSLRAKRRASAAGPEPLWLYTAVGVTLLLAAVLAQVPGVPRFVTAVAAALVPVQLVAGLAYLLRVVFPSAPRPIAKPTAAPASEQPAASSSAPDFDPFDEGPSA